MSMMKTAKKVSAAVVLGMSLVAVSNVGAYAATSSSSVIATARHSMSTSVPYMRNLPTNGAKINFRAASASTLDIINATVQNGDITIVGSDNGVPFSLQGPLFTNASPNIIYGNLTDSLGNFQVVRFEMTTNASNDLFINHSTLDGSSAMALYLKRVNTRDFVFGELPLSKIFSSANISSIFYDYSSLPKEPKYSSVNWLSQIVSPVLTKTESPKKFRTVSTSNSTNSLVASPNGTGSAPEEYWTESYALSYPMGPYQATDEITLGFDVVEPSSFGNGTSFTSTMNVVSTKYSQNSPAGTYSPSETNWEIGGDGNNGMQFETNSPEYIEDVTTQGQLQQAASLALSWSYSLGAYGFSGTLTYVPGGTMQLGPSGMYGGIASTQGNVHTMDWWSPSGDWLQYPGDFLKAQWLAANSQKTGNYTASNTMYLFYDLYNAGAVPPAGSTNQPLVGYNLGEVSTSVSWPTTESN